MDKPVSKKGIQLIQDLSDKGQLYAGYGSNLNAQDYQGFSDYKKPLEPVARGSVPDVELVFDKHSSRRECGVLSLRQRSGAVTGVVLFKADAKDWGNLNRKEFGYTRIPAPVLVYCDETRRYHEIMCETYVTTNPQGFVQPSVEKYLDIVEQGFKDHGLPTADLFEAAKGKPNGFSHMNHNIFTYGTLCRGGSREHVMQQPKLIQVGQAELAGGKLYDTSSGQYPCLVECDPGDESDWVKGDLWSYPVNNKLPVLFERLDAIEGDIRPTLGVLKNVAQDAIRQGSTVDEASQAAKRVLERSIEESLFRRTLVHVGFGGRVRQAWTYRYNQDVEGLKEVPQSDWREYKGLWDSTFLRVLKQLCEQHGGFEPFREKMAGSWQTSVAAGVNSIEEVLNLLKSGVLEERDLIVWCKPDGQKQRLSE